MATSPYYQVRTSEIAPPQQFDNTNFDLNTYINHGEYVIPSNTSITNTPLPGISGVLKVIRMNGFGVVLVLQYFFGTNLDNNSTCIYSRQTSDGGTVWSGWEKYIKASGDTFSGAIGINNPVAGSITIGTNASTRTVINQNNIKVNSLNVIGQIDASIGNFSGHVTSPSYTGDSYTVRKADLAEKYSCKESNLPVGTIIEISDDDNYEMQQCNTRDSEFVWGAVSDNAAIIMNNKETINPTIVGLIGKIPIRVLGSVKKRDKITSFKNGVGIVADEIDNNYFAISLENNSIEEEKLVMCLVGFNKRK